MLSWWLAAWARPRSSEPSPWRSTRPDRSPPRVGSRCGRATYSPRCIGERRGGSVQPTRIPGASESGRGSRRESAAFDRNPRGVRLRDRLGRLDPDLEDAVAVARLDVGLDHALWQRQTSRETAVVQLPAHEALLFELVLLAPLCLDVQHPVGDGQFHVPVGVDARQLGPYDEVIAVSVLVDPDEVLIPPTRLERHPQRQHLRPLVEKPVKAAEDVVRLGCPVLASSQTRHPDSPPLPSCVPAARPANESHGRKTRQDRLAPFARVKLGGGGTWRMR